MLLALTVEEGTSSPGMWELEEATNKLKNNPNSHRASGESGLAHTLVLAQ